MMRSKFKRFRMLIRTLKKEPKQEFLKASNCSKISCFMRIRESYTYLSTLYYTFKSYILSLVVPYWTGEAITDDDLH